MDSERLATNYKRNWVVELWRFVFALAVVMVHTHGLHPEDSMRYPFVGGYLGVEFFLLLTGYFTMNELAKADDTKIKQPGFPLYFVLNKFRNVYPYVIISVTIYCIVTGKIIHATLYEQLRRLIFGIFEMLLLQMTGLYQQMYIFPLWYLSAVFLALPVFIWLYTHLKSFFEDLFIWLFPLGVYGFFATAHGSADWWFDTVFGFLRVGILRAMAGLCLGSLCYKISLKLIKFRNKKLFLFVSTTFFILTLLIIMMHGLSHLDFLLIAMLMLGIIFLFSSPVPPCKNNIYIIFEFLGKYSLPLYITHWTVRDILNLMWVQGTYWEMLPVYLVASLLYALIIYGIVSLLKLYLKKM